MLSPRAFALIIRHLDALDLSLSRQMTRKSVPAEPSMTDAFCGLFDSDAQREYNIPYTIEQLNADLFDADALMSLNLNITTHPYSQTMEGAATQADLGLIINYRDFFAPDNSWSNGMLLQAKRLFPDRENPARYSAGSRFRSFDENQHTRMLRLKEAFGIDFIHYLLYCPRPQFLPPIVKAKLAYERHARLIGSIFDYTFGLQLHDDFMSAESTLAAGVFVSLVDNRPDTLSDVHARIFNSSWPLSWLIATHFRPDRLDPRERRQPRWGHGAYIPIDPRGGPPAPNPRTGLDATWAHALIRGEENAVGMVQEIFPNGRELRLTPPATLTIDINVADPHVLERER